MVIGIIALLAALFLPALARAKARAQWMRCTSNLKIAGVSFNTWALDHHNAYPMSVPGTNGGSMEAVAAGEVFLHFQAISNELATPWTLVCPADARTRATNFGPGFSNTNISYFVGLDAQDTMPQMFLTGDRNLTNGPLLPNRILVLNTNSPVGWAAGMHNGMGNVGLADGSVQGFSTTRLQEALLYSGGTNRLAMP